MELPQRQSPSLLSSPASPQHKAEGCLPCVVTFVSLLLGNMSPRAQQLKPQVSSQSSEAHPVLVQMRKQAQRGDVTYPSFYTCELGGFERAICHSGTQFS